MTTDPVATRARVVREALERWSDTVGEADRVVEAARIIVSAASDQGLSRLARILKFVQ